jgi:UDP-glucose 4-epimerase
VFNVGRDKPYNFLELAKTIIDIADNGSWKLTPFSPERAAQEPGNYYSDISKIKKIIGWEPKTELKEGLKETISYYKHFRQHYW